MWKYTKWNKVVKIVISGLFGIIMICSCGNENKTNTVDNNVKTEVNQYEELENNSKEYTIEEATEKGTKMLEEQIESEIEEKQNILRKKCRSYRNRRVCRSKCNI